jgi:CemA family
MTSSFKNQLQSIFTKATQWFTKTPERAIDRAYEAAVNIKKIEEEYFGGNPISENAGYSENTFSLFNIQLRKYLSTIDARLTEYKLSSRVPYLLPQNSIEAATRPLGNPIIQDANPSITQKLAFIDYILARYRVNPIKSIKTQPDTIQLLDVEALEPQDKNKFVLFPHSQKKDTSSRVTPVEKSILPGSFTRAFDRVRRNLTPSYSSYENDVVDELRQSRKRTNAAIRYCVILVIATIVVQVVSKNLVYGPIVDYWTNQKPYEIQLSPEFDEEALKRFSAAKEKIEFERLIGKYPNLSPAEAESQLREEAINIIKFYKNASLDGIKNLLADFTAVLAFNTILVAGKRQVLVIKDFIDEVLFSLSDNAKAFLIIVSTDTFVGFHSSEGWDALLTSLFFHFGIHENRIFIMAFIATVPVFLDGLFKFWIFQYLRQSSPSTAAIYGEMDS